MRKRAKYSVQELQAAALPLPNDFYSWLGKEVFKSRCQVLSRRVASGGKGAGFTRRKDRKECEECERWWGMGCFLLLA